MKNVIIWLRISYCWGIIADAVMAFLMIFPAALPLKFASDPVFRFGMRNGAPLMIGWTLLLLWANHKPVERKDILPLTLLVVAGYMLVELDALFADLASLELTLPLLGMQTAMSIVFIFSYLKARNATT